MLLNHLFLTSEFFVLVLKHAFWVIRVNYLSSQGVCSGRGWTGAFISCQSLGLPGGELLLNGNTLGLGRGRLQCVSHLTL